MIKKKKIKRIKYYRFEVILGTQYVMSKIIRIYTYILNICIILYIYLIQE